MSSFQAKVGELISRKKSNLSVGLDPGLPGQVREDAVPEKYLARNGRYQGIVDFCLAIIDKVADSAVTIKITQPYVMGLSDEQHRIMTDRIRQKGALSIYDMKLGSTLRTAFAALWYCNRWGYDAVTLNPCLGDTEATIKAAKGLKPSLGTLVNVLSSAPSAAKYVATACIGSKGVPEEIISDMKKYKPDGCLLGSGRYVTSDLLTMARQVLGDHSVLVFVVGNNEKEASRILKHGGKASLINVGRDIIYSDDPRKKAEKWVKRLRVITARRESHES